MSTTENIIRYFKTINARRSIEARRKLAMSHQGERHCIKPLTQEQKKEIDDFWFKVSGTRKKYFDYSWYEIYNGVCTEPEKLKFYIPNDFYYCYIDYFFADDHYGRKFDDKTLYELYFPEVRHPETLVRKSGGNLLNNRYQIIDVDEAVRLCREAGTVIYKEALISTGGKSIRFWSVDDDEQKLRNLLATKNFVIQKLIHQHEVLSKIHPSSVNTIRVLTLLFNDKVDVMSAILRMGSNGKKVDNGSSGGMFCGIQSNGQLRSTGYDFSGIGHDHHPQGTRFSDVTIPNFAKICELAKQMAPRLQNITKLISWDFALGTDGEPILVESNLYYGGCNVHQLSNGPIFGDKTEEILCYVFKNNPFLK